MGIVRVVFGISLSPVGRERRWLVALKGVRWIRLNQSVHGYLPRGT
jgi:hypothetical protein